MRSADSSAVRTRALRASVAVALIVVVATGQAEPEGVDALSTAMRAHRVVLLGEVHDNPQLHALRLHAFDALLASGARPALLMEQFDREQQATIDRARVDAHGAAGADRIIAAASGPKSGWNWDFYRPFIERALRFDLPIVAVNVSRDDARTVIAKGLAGAGFDAVVPKALEDLQASSIEATHCGMVDAAMAHRMAAAQIARDQFMASAIEARPDRPVVLLTGNGHVRRDVGVPHWLSPATRQATISIGMLEVGDAKDDAFDRSFHSPTQARDDPCASMRTPPPAR